MDYVMNKDHDFDLAMLKQNKHIYDYFVIQNLLSFKSMWFYARCPSIASTAMTKFLHNINLCNDGSYKFFGDDDIVETAFMSRAFLGSANYIYQISQRLLIKILSGNSPFLNFSVVRNPYLRMVSAIYHYRRKHKIDDNMSSLDILKYFYYERDDVNFMSITQMIAYDYVKYDFIIRYEDLSNDMRILFPQYKNQRSYPATQQSFADQLLANDEFIALVQEHHNNDFNNFGYSCDIKEINDYDNSVLPRSCDKWQNPCHYPCDISLLYGDDIVNINANYNNPPQYIGDFIARLTHLNYYKIPNIIQQWKDKNHE